MLFRSDVGVSMELMARLKSRQMSGAALQEAAPAETVGAAEPTRGAPVFSKRSFGVGALTDHDGPNGVDLGASEEVADRPRT